MTSLSCSLTTLLNNADINCGALSIDGSRAGCFVVSAPAAAAPRNSWGSRRATSRGYHLLPVAAQAHWEKAATHFGTRKSSLKRSWQCHADLEEAEAQPAPEDSDSSCCTDSTAATSVTEEAESSGGGGQVFETYGPGKQGNQLIAVASITVAVGLFLSGRIGGGGPGLPDLAASAISYQEALANGRPTVVEFYADWCEVCKETAHDVYEVEQEYRDKINFVMLNVDNSKWEEELDEFGVEGIPHFAFLDGQGNEEGNIVGRLPRKILKENLAALARGDASVPHTRVVGQFSSADSKQAPPVVGPRSHSQMS
ncbi:unnamed protein product [Calypogeia fissa]